MNIQVTPFKTYLDLLKNIAMFGYGRKGVYAIEHNDMFRCGVHKMRTLNFIISVCSMLC